MALLSFLFVPIVLIILWISAFARNRRTGLGLSLIFFTLTCAIGFWSIIQSRSSTAAIGVLFLPFYACVSGALAWGFENLKKSTDSKRKRGSWVLLAGAIGVNGVLIYGGFKTINTNKERDLQQKIRSETIEKNRQWIKENLAKQVGNEEAWLSSLAEEKKEDSTFLLPLLDQKQLPATALEKLATKDDMGVVLQVARHKNTPPTVLEKIYANKQYPEYFYQALATNPNTPVEILQKLHDKPSYMNNLDQNLAENPSIKKETLKQIANSKKVLTLWNTISNPVCDCEIIKIIYERLDRSKLEDDYKNWDRFVEDLNQKKAKCDGSKGS